MLEVWVISNSVQVLLMLIDKYRVLHPYSVFVKNKNTTNHIMQVEQEKFAGSKQVLLKYRPVSFIVSHLKNVGALYVTAQQRRFHTTELYKTCIIYDTSSRNIST